jgi:L-lactate permease|tara:strand:- start:373 stop:717 length:345 start_codon:yes stop_codon:yes gene_type:complete
MNAYKANLINSITLITIGLWGYFESSSVTALIPVVFGFILIVCSKGVKSQNKLVAHIAVLLTLIILLALVGMRLPKSIDSGGLGLIRVLAMIATSTLAMIFFVKSFIDARKNKS